MYNCVHNIVYYQREREREARNLTDNLCIMSKQKSNAYRVYANFNNKSTSGE